MRPGATAQQIKDAYRQLAKELHPDVAGAAGEAGMADVNAAYDLLMHAREAPPTPQAQAQPPARRAEVPPGFELYPRKGWLSSPRYSLSRFGDEREGALSIAASGADLRGLDQLGPDDVWLLDLSDLPVSDAEVRRVWRIHRLEQLDLSKTSVTSRGLVGIGALTRLDTLQLTGCAIDDTALELLAELPLLSVVGLGGTRVTADGLRHLRGHPSLMTIDLRWLDVGTAAVDHLATLPKLRTVSLTGRSRWRLRSLRRLRPEVTFS